MLKILATSQTSQNNLILFILHIKHVSNFKNKLKCWIDNLFLIVVIQVNKNKYVLFEYCMN